MQILRQNEYIDKYGKTHCVENDLELIGNEESIYQALQVVRANVESIKKWKTGYKVRVKEETEYEVFADKMATPKKVFVLVMDYSTKEVESFTQLVYKYYLQEIK